MGKKGLSLFGIITSAINPVSHDNERAVMLYSRNNNEISTTLPEFSAVLSADAMLQATGQIDKKFGDSSLSFWQIKNLSASRKKFEVFLRAFYTAE